MNRKKLISMIQNDISRYDDIIGESKRRGIEFTSKVYADLMGKYSRLEGFPMIQDGSVWLQAYPSTYLENIIKILGFLKTYVLQNEEVDETATNHSNNTDRNYKKVFIVHGHDGELKQSVARIIEKQGIEAIILSEQVNTGKTIIEKLETHSDVGAAICLFTNDDFGRGNNEKELKPRARQNVVFEAGYFMGYLGRDHVIMIADTENEIPGDLGGMVYASSSDWKIDLCKNLKAMGYTIDFNKLF